MTHPSADIPKCSKIRHNKEQQDSITRFNPTKEYHDQEKMRQNHTEFNSLQGPALVSPCQPLNANNPPRVPPPLSLVSTIEPELVEETGLNRTNLIHKVHTIVSPSETVNSAIVTSIATYMGPLKEHFPLCQTRKLWQPHCSQTIHEQKPQFSVESVRHVNNKDLKNFENLRNNSSHEGFIATDQNNNNILIMDYSNNGAQQQQQQQELLTHYLPKHLSPPPLIPQLHEESLRQNITKHGLLTLSTTTTPVSKPMPLPPPLMYTPPVTKDNCCSSGVIVPVDIQDAAALLCFLKASSVSSSSPQLTAQQKQSSSTPTPTPTERGEGFPPSLIKYQQPHQTSTQGLTEEEIIDTSIFRKESRPHHRHNKNNRCYQNLSPLPRDEKDVKKPVVCEACSNSSFSSDCDISLTLHKNKSTASTNTHHPTRLSFSNDSEELNSLHCFVRSDLLEIFVVPPPPSPPPPKKGEMSKQQQQRGRRRKRLSNRLLSSHHDSREECRGDDDGDHEDGSDLEDSLPQKQRNHLHHHNFYDEEEATTNFGTCRTAATANNSTTTSTRLFPGRVGLRCVHCAHIPRSRRPKRKRVMSSSSPEEHEHDYEEPGNNDHYDRDEVGTSNTKHAADNSINNYNKSTAKPTTTTPRAAMSLFYPKSLADLYRAVCTWQRVHFRACPHVPESVRNEYNYRKDSDRTRGKTKYWTKSARAIGLVDVEGFHGRGGLRFVKDCCERKDDDDDDENLLL